MPDSHSTIRSFIAVEINEGVRSRLAEIQAQLKKTDADIKWVAPPNVHVTLVFLGDIVNDLLAGIGAALDRMAQAVTPFALEAHGLGFFGSPRAPKVIWAGLRGDVQPLLTVQQHITEAVRAAGITPDNKPFHPHLTIGRARSTRNADKLLAGIEAAQDESFGRIEVTRILLMKSVLAPQGPIYSILHASPFGPAA